MIDFNSSATLRAEAVERIAEAIDSGLRKAQAESKPRTYLGASALGEECERRIQLDYIRANDMPGAPVPSGDGFSAMTLRIFGIGHALEELAAGWLQTAGYDLRTHGADGRQFGFSVADGQLGGHCDGVIVGGPKGTEYPLLWEHKAVGRKSWQEIVKKGVTVARPVYAAQIALYQGYLDLPNPALFMATNRDTAEIYLEMVPFDGALAQATGDKAVRVLQATRAGDLLPREYAQADHYQCKMCRWAEFCWGSER